MGADEITAPIFGLKFVKLCSNICNIGRRLYE